MLCPRKNCKPGAVGVMLPNIEGKVSGNGNIAYCCSPHQALLSMITLKKCYEYYFKAGYFLSQNSRLLVETLINLVLDISTSLKTITNPKSALTLLISRFYKHTNYTYITNLELNFIQFLDTVSFLRQLKQVIAKILNNLTSQVINRKITLQNEQLVFNSSKLDQLGSNTSYNLSFHTQVVDVQTGQPLGPNKDGEVCIRGPVVMKGCKANRDLSQSFCVFSQSTIKILFIRDT